MFEMDHVAISCPDIGAGVDYYVENFGAQVLYQDKTWAFLRMGQGKLALVTPGQHPPHVAYRVSEETLEASAIRARIGIDLHRDGTKGIYVEDPFGNVVELICYPVGGDGVWVRGRGEGAHTHRRFSFGFLRTLYVTNKNSPRTFVRGLSSL